MLRPERRGHDVGGEHRRHAHRIHAGLGCLRRVTERDTIAATEDSSGRV